MTRPPIDPPAGRGDDAGPPGPEQFATTRWTVVVAAASADTGEARAALDALCRAYWRPLYGFARRRGADAATAQDLVQGFFAKLAERPLPGTADPSRGRFRSYLLAAFRNHAADVREHAAALKRGGGERTPDGRSGPVAATLSLDVPRDDAAAGYLAEPAHGRTPEREFERRWALDVLAAALRRTIAEIERADSPSLHRALLPFLGGPGDAAPYAAIARDHGTTEGAVKVAVHRLRRRHREHLRAVVRDTVAPSDDAEGAVDEEIRDLLRAFTDAVP